jgi:hypothetical protein
VFTFPRGGAGAALWFDDLILIDNALTLVSGKARAAPAEAAVASIDSAAAAPAPAPAPGTRATSPRWSVVRQGNNYVGQAPMKFTFKLLTADAAKEGWELHEVNDLRARFVSPQGKSKTVTVYSDGRSYWDSAYKGLSRETRDAPAFAEQHEWPAQVAVPADLGRVNRTTPGDANNDGYNESRGAYQVVAAGSRLEIKLTPQTRTLVRPVIEVTGLPPGNVLITIEGRLIEQSMRLEDGTMLIELPGTLNRATTVNLRLE